MSRPTNIKFWLAPEGQAYCMKCDTYKSTDDFNQCNDDNGFNGFRKYCKECIRKNAQKYKESRVITNKIKNYQISAKQYAELLEKQGGVCAICKKPETKIHKGTLASLCVDHDHETNMIRGLLCSACNTGLGLFRDDINLLKLAIDYLIRSNAKPKMNAVNHQQVIESQEKTEKINRIARNLPKKLMGSTIDYMDSPLFAVQE